MDGDALDEYVKRVIEPISDERLAALRMRTGAWPSNSEECLALIARLDAAEALLKECTHCKNPGCPHYNGPIGWDRREQYS